MSREIEYAMVKEPVVEEEEEVSEPEPEVVLTTMLPGIDLSGPIPGTAEHTRIKARKEAQRVVDELAEATKEAELRSAKVQEAKQRYFARKRQKIA